MVTKKESVEKRDPAVAAILKPYQEDMKRYMGALKEEFESRVSGIGEQFVDIKKDIKEIKQTLDSHTEMIGKVMVDVTEIKSDLKQKVDYADFAKLEKRVRLLEVKH